MAIGLVGWGAWGWKGWKEGNEGRIKSAASSGRLNLRIGVMLISQPSLDPAPRSRYRWESGIILEVKKG